MIIHFFDYFFCTSFKAIGIQESSYEQKEFSQVERHVLNRIDLENIRKLVNDRNPKLWKVFCMKELNGEAAETSFFVGDLLVVFGIILYRMVQYVSAVHGHDEA